MEWQKIRLFISSTFKDMHYEREYLVKNVLLDLKNWCMQRRIVLSEIDFRWGVTEEDTNSGSSIEKCLYGVDKARPFFLCLLGERYGWIPEREGSQLAGNGFVSDDTLSKYPEIKDLVDKRKSVTEMEIFYALEGGNSERPCDAVVFLRNILKGIPDISVREKDKEIRLRDIYTNGYLKKPDEIAYAESAMRRLKESYLPSKGIETVSYTSEFRREALTNFRSNGRAFADEILDRLKITILRQFPDRKDISDDRIGDWREDQQLRLFQLYISVVPKNELQAAASVYGLRVPSGYTDETDAAEREYIRGRSRLLITGETGSGKSTLFARYVKEKAPDCVYYFIDRSADGTENAGRILQLLGNTELPDGNIGMMLLEAAKLCVSQKKTLALDNIEALPVQAVIGMLSYPELSFVCTVSSNAPKYGVIQDWAVSTKVGIYVSAPLKSNFAKSLLINTYFEDYLKTLSDNQMEQIISLERSDNPLYLRLLLSEFRLFGSFNDLNSKIKEYVDNVRSIEEAFSYIVKRIITDYRDSGISEDVPRKLIALLVASENGLTNTEWETAAKAWECPEKEIAYIVKQIDDFFEKRFIGGETVINFGYTQFRNAAGGCVSELLEKANEILRSVFEKRSAENNAPLRVLEGFFYHSARAGRAAAAASVEMMARRTEQGGYFRLVKDLRQAGNTYEADFLTRYSSSLSREPDSLASLLIYEGGRLSGEAMRYAKDSQKPYYSTETRVLAVPADDPPRVSDNASNLFRITDSGEYARVYASAYASEKNIVFRIQKNGVISVFPAGQSIQSGVVNVEKGRVLSLFASNSGEYIAVAYESGRLLVVKVHYSESAPAWSETLLDTKYLLPEVYDPVMRWRSDNLVWQNAHGEIIISTFEKRSDKMINTADGELAGICSDNVFIYRRGEVCKIITERKTINYDYNVLAYGGNGRMTAAAFNDEKLIVLSDTDGSIIAQFEKVGRVLSLCFDKDRLYALVHHRSMDNKTQVLMLVWDGKSKFLQEEKFDKAPIQAGIYSKAVFFSVKDRELVLLTDISFSRAQSNIKFGKASEKPMVACADISNGALSGVVYKGKNFFYCTEDKVYGKLETEYKNLIWASAGSWFVGCVHELPEGFSVMSRDISECRRPRVPIVFRSVAGSPAGILLFDSNDRIYFVEDDYSLRVLANPHGLKDFRDVESFRGAGAAVCFVKQSYDNISNSVVLTICLPIDTHGTACAKPYAALVKLSEMRFPSEEGHFQSYAIDINCFELYVFVVKSEGMFLEVYSLNTYSKVFKTVLPYVKAAKTVHIAEGVIYVSSGDGHIIAMTPRGERLCGLYIPEHAGHDPFRVCDGVLVSENENVKKLIAIHE